MDPIGVFLSGIVTSAEARVVLPAVSLALLIAGLYWAFTHSEHGKTKAIAALMGGALAIMAPTLATALSGGVPH
jgi:hypothetical protein